MGRQATVLPKYVAASLLLGAQVFFSYKKIKKLLVGAVGIEPTTFGLKGRCSTTELRP